MIRKSNWLAWDDLYNLRLRVYRILVMRRGGVTCLDAWDLWSLWSMTCEALPEEMPIEQAREAAQAIWDEMSQAERKRHPRRIYMPKQPDSVEAKYRRENPFEAFLRDCCQKSDGDHIHLGLFLEAFRSWEEERVPPAILRELLESALGREAVGSGILFGYRWNNDLYQARWSCRRTSGAVPASPASRAECPEWRSLCRIPVAAPAASDRASTVRTS